MYTKYADKGTERWEIYAWCVRDAMAKAGNFRVVDDLTIQDKLKYEKFMCMSTDTCTINQQVYTLGNRKED